MNNVKVPGVSGAASLVGVLFAFMLIILSGCVVAAVLALWAGTFYAVLLRVLVWLGVSVG